jgi:hypothetical protein
MLNVTELKKQLKREESFLFNSQFSRFPVSESDYIKVQNLRAQIAKLESEKPKKQVKGIFNFLKF